PGEEPSAQIHPIDDGEVLLVFLPVGLLVLEGGQHGVLVGEVEAFARRIVFVGGAMGRIDAEETERRLFAFRRWRGRQNRFRTRTRRDPTREGQSAEGTQELATI